MPGDPNFCGLLHSFTPLLELSLSYSQSSLQVSPPSPRTAEAMTVPLPKGPNSSDPALKLAGTERSHKEGSYKGCGSTEWGAHSGRRG